MELSDIEEKTIIEKLRSSPRLKACFLEMLDITSGENFEELETGDDAEEAVVESIQKTGQALLQEWVERKKDKAEEEAVAGESYRLHEKKSPLANVSRQD